MTEYTRQLEDQDLSAAEFLLRCAKAFGPAAHMRDEPLDGPLRAPSRSAVDAALDDVSSATRDLDSLRATTIDQARVSMEAERAAAAEAQRAEATKRATTIARTERLLVGVRAWDPPTPQHEVLKDFAIVQLSEVLFDMVCEPREPQPQTTPAEWLEQRVRAATSRLKVAVEYLDKCQRIFDARSAWIAALKGSLDNLDDSRRGAFA